MRRGILIALLAPLFIILWVLCILATIGSLLDRMAEAVCDLGHWLEDKLDPS